MRTERRARPVLCRSLAVCCRLTLPPDKHNQQPATNSRQQTTSVASRSSQAELHSRSARSCHGIHWLVSLSACGMSLGLSLGSDTRQTTNRQTNSKWQAGKQEQDNGGQVVARVGMSQPLACTEATPDHRGDTTTFRCLSPRSPLIASSRVVSDRPTTHNTQHMHARSHRAVKRASCERDERDERERERPAAPCSRQECLSVEAHDARLDFCTSSRHPRCVSHQSHLPRPYSRRLALHAASQNKPTGESRGHWLRFALLVDLLVERSTRSMCRTRASDDVRERIRRRQDRWLTHSISTRT